MLFDVKTVAAGGGVSRPMARAAATGSPKKYALISAPPTRYTAGRNAREGIPTVERAWNGLEAGRAECGLQSRARPVEGLRHDRVSGRPRDAFRARPLAAVRVRLAAQFVHRLQDGLALR